MDKIFLILSLMIGVVTFAQTDEIDTSAPSNDMEIATETISVEDTIIDYSGTLLTSNREDFRKVFVRKYQFPENSEWNGISELLVIEFIVEKNGYATNINVVKSLCETCDAEVIRILKITKFKPFEVDGILSRCRYRLPIRLAVIE